jgi:hypothetical protein
VYAQPGLRMPQSWCDPHQNDTSAEEY